MTDKFSELKNTILKVINLNEYDIIDNEKNIKNIIEIYKLLEDNNISNIISLIEELELKEGVEYKNK